jgi:hypothetical protein
MDTHLKKKKTKNGVHLSFYCHTSFFFPYIHSKIIIIVIIIMMMMMMMMMMTTVMMITIIIKTLKNMQEDGRGRGGRGGGLNDVGEFLFICLFVYLFICLYISV